jgi:hypothetical protein
MSGPIDAAHGPLPVAVIARLQKTADDDREQPREDPERESETEPPARTATEAEVEAEPDPLDPDKGKNVDFRA